MTKRGLPPGVSLEVTDRVSENDRDWFEARPGRCYRARPWVEGESPLWDWGAGNPYVIVRQVRPGARLRIPLGWAGAPLELVDEARLAKLWLKFGGGAAVRVVEAVEQNPPP